MRIFITLTLLVFLVSDTLSSSHDQPAIGPSQITKLIDNLKYHEQQETYIETKIQQTVENLKAAAADVYNQINGFITRKRKVKKETLMKLKELELKLSKLKTSVKECLQRLIKANQKRSGQKEHQRQEAEGDDQEEEASGVEGEEENEQKPFRDVEIEEQEDEQPGPSGRGHYGFPLSASWEDWEDYVEQFLDGRRDFTDVDQEGPSGESSGDEAGGSDEDGEPLDEQEESSGIDDEEVDEQEDGDELEGNETDEEPLLEHGGSIGVEDEEDDEQEQDLMDGLREPTEVEKQDDDNRKESRSRRVGSSPQPP